MKIVLVQFYSYHEEVLTPQVDFLLPDNEVFVAAPKNVFNHDYMKPFCQTVRKIEFTNRKYDSKKIIDIPRRMFSIFIKYIQLHRVVKKQKIDLIIFNTINKSFHFKFIKLFFSRIDKIHIIHNAQMFLSEKSARPLSLFKQNLFISKDVYNYYINNAPVVDKAFFDWFFPSLEHCVSSDSGERVSFSENKITLVVPGSVDERRRNYAALLDVLTNSRRMDGILQIVFLGRISSEKQKEIIDKGLDSIIKTYTDYVPGIEMLRQIKASDVIAFLVDRTIGENCQLYNKYKASGTSVLCLSFGIPCVVSDDFAIDEALKERAVVYHGSHIENILFDILDGKITKEYFGKLKNIPLPAEYSFNYQLRHYRDIVARNMKLPAVCGDYNHYLYLGEICAICPPPPLHSKRIAENQKGSFESRTRHQFISRKIRTFPIRQTFYRNRLLFAHGNQA